MVSLAGTYMQTVAEGWLVYELTNSAFSLGLVGFVVLIPLAPWALVAGALADRWPRKQLLAVAQVVQVVPPLMLASLVWTGQVHVWHVILANLIMAAAAAVDHPVRQALVVDLVPPEELDNAYALSAAGLNIARVLGPAAAGVLIGSAGLTAAFALNGLSYLALLIALAFIAVPQHDRPARRESLGANLIGAGRYLAGERVILSLLALMTIVCFFVLPYQTLLPVFARDILKAGAPGLGLLTATAGVGAILGALTVANLRRRHRGVLAMALVVALAPLTAAFAFSTSLALSCLILILISGGVVAFKTLGITLIQLQTNDDLRGRVTSVLLLVIAAAPRLGGFVAGYVANRQGTPFALALAAMGCLLFGLLSMAVFMRWLKPVA
jgi:predicted MFS family arabinose efflux permease